MRLGPVLALMLVPKSALALSLVETSTSLPLWVEVKSSLFVQIRNTSFPGEQGQTQFLLSRARIGLDAGWGKHISIQIEPDFGGPSADIADAFLTLRPIEHVRFRAGRQKVPYGELEIEARWDIPSIRRGLVNTLLADRLGMAGRKVGFKGRVKIDEIPLRPRLTIGVFRDAPERSETDVASRLRLRLKKRTTLMLAGYARDGVSASGGYGWSGSLAALYNRRGLYLFAEGIVVRAALLQLGAVADVDSTMVMARALASYGIPFGDWRVGPYLAGEIVDPNVDTRDDLGGAVRGGITVRFLDYGRASLEVDHQMGQLAFAEPERTVITLLIGGYLR